MKTSHVLTCGIIAGLLLLPAGHAQAFSDTANHWASADITRLTELQAIGGYEDGTFKPDHSITRAEFSKILCKSLGLTTITGHVFDDTTDHWANADLFTLFRQNILVPEEYGHYYQPDTPITRVEMAIMLVRALDLNTEASRLSTQSTAFADDSAIANYHKGFITLAQQFGLVSGYEDNTFRPQASATRAEASAMIVRLLDTLDSAAPTVPADKPTEPAQTGNGSGSDTAISDQVSSDLNLSGHDITISTSTRSNSLGEETCTASLSLLIQNTGSTPLTITAQSLHITAVYHQNGQRREAPVQLTDFMVNVPAGGSLSQSISFTAIMPTTLAGQLALGDKLTGFTIAITTNGQTLTLENLTNALTAAL